MKRTTLNLFFTTDVMKAFLEKHSGNGRLGEGEIFTDCAFTVDIITAPQRLYYHADSEQAELILDSRGLLYETEEKETHRVATSFLNRKGEVRGSVPDELQDLMRVYLMFCLNLAVYLRKNGIFEQYPNLNPETQGVLMEEKENELVMKPVTGDERPDLVCKMLSGELKIMRPYKADIMRGVLLDAMPLEKKEAAAESGDKEMMRYLFDYYMGNSSSAKKDLERNARKMMKAMSAISGNHSDEQEDGDEEEDTRNPEKAFYWLKKLAESGDTGAMNALSIFYTKAFGTERDFKKAAEWRKKAAENGLVSVAGQDGLLLAIGETKEKAEAGDAQAQGTYAKMLWAVSQDNPELGSDKDQAEAFQWAQKSASKFNLDGIFTLASFYENGIGTVKDAEKAFRLVERAASKGHVPSQTKLGLMFLQGVGTQENPQAAYEWCRKAAEAGDMNGMSNLAACYLLGKGVEQNQGKAVEWLQKAAELGDEGAKGVLEKIGAPLKAQPHTLEELVKAAEQGSVQAMKMLINFYINRPGGRDDLIEAEKWAQKAADLGDEEAKATLQNLKETKEGKLVSFRYALTDAEKGNPAAQCLVGSYYACGYQTERDFPQALYWMKKAASAGREDAQSFVEGFKNIEEVERKAANGDPQAIGELAKKYIALSNSYNYEREKTIADGLQLAQRAAGMGNAIGQYVLGHCYENGIGLEKNDGKAFELYSMSAEQEFADAELALANLYLLGKGTNADPDAAVSCLDRAVQHGNPDAEKAREMYPQILLNVGLDKMGDGTNTGGRDPELGVRFVKKAAEIGHGQAQFALGMMYLNGKQVEQDFENAMVWLKKASENGFQQAADAIAKFDKPEAYNNAANREFMRKDKAPDKEKVFRLMKHAAESGMAASQSTLGILYMNGVGVAPDYKKGMEWLQKAADQGHERAASDLKKFRLPGDMFRVATIMLAYNKKNGLDSADARDLLEKAAEAGSAEANNLIGLFYAAPKSAEAKFGVLLERNQDKAKHYFEKALELKPDLSQADNNLKKLTAEREAEKNGAPASSELKWALALPFKKKTSSNENNREPDAGSGEHKTIRENSETSEEDHIPSMKK